MTMGGNNKDFEIKIGFSGAKVPLVLGTVEENDPFEIVELLPEAPTDADMAFLSREDEAADCAAYEEWIEEQARIAEES